MRAEERRSSGDAMLGWLSGLGVLCDLCEKEAGAGGVAIQLGSLGSVSPNVGGTGDRSG